MQTEGMQEADRGHAIGRQKACRMQTEGMQEADRGHAGCRQRGHAGGRQRACRRQTEGMQGHLLNIDVVF